MRVIGIRAVVVGVACGVGEFGRGNRDNAVGGAVGGGSECCGVGGTGTGEIGECTTGNGDVGLDEVGGSF